ncbi:MAG: ABC transporter ATP-binding protein [Acidobacteriota bacterium]
MIRLQGISRTFQVGDQEVRALRHVDLTIESGEYIALMGPSGSGKSTLLHLLGLLDRPTAGRYELRGTDVTTLDDIAQAAIRSRTIGFVFQFFHLVPRLTAAENIELPLILASVPPAERKPRVAQALESFGLTPRAHHRPDQLSGGQRQRVAIARAMVLDPPVLLADEPTGNLDRTTGHDVVLLLEQLNARGITLIVVTHDTEIGARARRRVRLIDGEIAQDTTTLAT